MTMAMILAFGGGLAAASYLGYAFVSNIMTAALDAETKRKQGQDLAKPVKEVN